METPVPASIIYQYDIEPEPGLQLRLELFD